MMLHCLRVADRGQHQPIFTQMFQSRAEVFRQKLGWDVEVHDGLEFDRHDTESDPLYLVLTDGAQRVTASLRLLPTTGDTMVGREFAHMFDEPVDVRSPSVWECTRFCVPNGRTKRDAPAGQASSHLLIGLCEFCLDNGIEQILGLYERPMARIYRRIGWSPAPLARSKPEAGDLFVGIWDATEAALANMRRVAERGEETRAA